MRAYQTGFAALAAAALTLLALGAEAAGPPPTVRYQVERTKGIAATQLGTVAILPPVAIDDNRKAEIAVEKGWRDLTVETRTRWLPADEVLARLCRVPGGIPDLAAEAEAEVWRFGAPLPGTGARLAHLLGVEAVLSLRIERWEVVDGGRGTVGLTATLTGVNGARLWSASGVAEFGAPRKSGEGNWIGDLTAVWDPRLEPRPEEQRLGVALYSLLASWSPELPAPLYEDPYREPMLAGKQPASR
jgi:hypothetical protein